MSGALDRHAKQTRNPAPETRDSQHLRRLGLLAPWALGLAGCLSSQNRLPATATQDPLLGGAVGRPTSTVAPAPPRHEQLSGAAPAAGPAADASTTSNVKTDGAPSKPVNVTLMAPAETLSPSNASLAMQSNAKLASTSAAGTAQGQWQTAGAQSGLEQAFQRLQQLNVLEQRLELRGGQWTFTCDLPNPQYPQQKRRFEGCDATPLGAVRGVLDRIEMQNRQ